MHISAENQNTYSRRTLTIAPNINRWIQRLRATALNSNIEYDYTQVANLLMAIGITTFEHGIRADDMDYISKLHGDVHNLQLQGLIDMHEDMVRKLRSQSQGNGTIPR